MVTQDESVLFVHHSDITSPYKSTVPYYLSSRVAESRTVHVLCRDLGEESPEEELPAEYEVHAFDTGQVRVLSGLVFVCLSTLYAFALSLHNRYDVVYAFQMDLLQGWVAARAAGARYVVGLQSVPVRQNRSFVQFGEDHRTLRTSLSLAAYEGYRAVTEALLSRATEVVCLTDGIREVTAEAYSVDLSDAHVIGMGIDVEQFTPSRLRRDGSPQELTTITYVGTLSPSRRIDRLIEAVAAVDGDVELVLAGTASDEHVDSLRETAREAGVEDRVDWLGMIPHEQVARVLGETDIAVSPLPDIEAYRVSYPAKLLEYMASECLVVASDIPAHRRVVDDGENGFLYDGSVAGLTETIEHCLDADDDRAAAVRAAAGETARDQDWDAVVRRHQAVMFAH